MLPRWLSNVNKISYLADQPATRRQIWLDFMIRWFIVLSGKNTAIQFRCYAIIVHHDSRNRPPEGDMVYLHEFEGHCIAAVNIV